MNYLTIAEAVLAELGTAKEAKKAKEAPHISHNSLLSHEEGPKKPPRWTAEPRREIGHLEPPEQALVIRRLIQTGAVLVLEGEDGVTYRAHEDGAELPEDIAILPRHELPEEGRQ